MVIGCVGAGDIENGGGLRIEAVRSSEAPHRHAESRAAAAFQWGMWTIRGCGASESSIVLLTGGRLAGEG